MMMESILPRVLGMGAHRHDRPWSAFPYSSIEPSGMIPIPDLTFFSATVSPSPLKKAMAGPFFI